MDVEPSALRAGVPPRSLQAFLGLLTWDNDRLVDRLQWMVTRDHGHHNTAAKASHAKTTRRNLLRTGIDVDRIRSCLDSSLAMYCQYTPS